MYIYTHIHIHTHTHIHIHIYIHASQSPACEARPRMREIFLSTRVKPMTYRIDSSCVIAWHSTLIG